MNKDKWYALRVVSGKERKVKEYIDKVLETDENLSKLVKNVVLPTEKVYKVRKGKKYSMDKNFFPGYLLVEANMCGEVIHSIEKITNVIHFLKEGKKAIPLRDSEVNRMLIRVDESEEKSELDVPFIVGEKIQITDGPFASFTGEITSIDKIKKRAKVDVKIFGRDTPLELDFLQIDKI